jgi:choline dehydrogenase-like flavoprotein
MIAMSDSSKMAALEFASTPFDFLVIGGGTAGLTVATRLSENPALIVGVLEAGSPAAVGESSRLDAVDIPGCYGQTLGTSCDWQFETLPQPGLGGRTLKWPRGKILGGTSALNFMTWNRANRQDYDAWRDLGNEGWGWDDLLLVGPLCCPFASREFSAGLKRDTNSS